MHKFMIIFYGSINLNFSDPYFLIKQIIMLLIIISFTIILEKILEEELDITTLLSVNLKTFINKKDHNQLCC